MPKDFYEEYLETHTLDEILRTISPASSNLITDRYILMPKASTYALGLHTLQEACVAERNQHQPQLILPDQRKVYRANTFLENILARMNDWDTLRDSNGKERTLEDRKRYFTTWLDSSCGVAYNSKSTKLKLNLQCQELMGIAKDFNEAFLSVDYASFAGDVTLDSSSQNFVRDAWLALLEEKTDVYQSYLGVLKAITGRDIIPGFWKGQNTEKDELRAVFVSYLDYVSYAGGGKDLYDVGRFLRRSP
ncbi:hypothetical protein HZC30_03860 [Candidatus Woesearchaeota archaeon]|nr:hypothetical protein [Candidatus Woesearchaeota archaeon]